MSNTRMDDTDSEMLAVMHGNLTAFECEPVSPSKSKAGKQQETQSVQPPAPEPPATITAEELAARMKVYVERILSDPAWHAEQARKREERAVRQRARDERIAARRLRKAA